MFDTSTHPSRAKAHKPICHSDRFDERAPNETWNIVHLKLLCRCKQKPALLSVCSIRILYIYLLSGIILNGVQFMSDFLNSTHFAKVTNHTLRPTKSSFALTKSPFSRWISPIFHARIPIKTHAVFTACSVHNLSPAHFKVAIIFIFY